MELATGLDLLGWSSVAAFLLGLALIARSVLGRGEPGTTVAGIRVVPLAGGLVLAVVGILGFQTASAGVQAGPGITTLLLGLGIAILVVALVDLLVRRAVPAAERVPGIAGLRPDRRWDAALALVLLVLVVAAVLWLRKADQIDAVAAVAPAPTSGPSAQASPSPSPAVGAPVPPAPTAPPASSASPELWPEQLLLPDPSVAPWRAPVELVTAYTLPAEPLDIVADGPRTGYLSTDTAGILRYELPSEDGGPLRLRVVASDVPQARGIAIKDGVLYAAQLTGLSCAPEIPLCEGAVLHPERPEAGELELMKVARARVLAWDITPDGSLGGRRTILSDLPVVDAFHGVNGMELGPDGWLYLPIGGIDRLWWDPAQVAGLTTHPELLGTIVRFDGTTTRPEVVADGLRNVFEVAWDAGGRMWAVDNDGNAQDGYRFEELLQVKRGRHYGYPEEGTLGPKQLRDDPAVWLSDTSGTAAIVWAPDVGLGEGMLIGGCGPLTLLAPTSTVVQGTWEHRLEPGSQARVYDGVGGCMSGAEPAGNRTLLAGVFGSGSGKLLAIRFAEPAHESPGPADTAAPSPPPA